MSKPTRVYGQSKVEKYFIIVSVREIHGNMQKNILIDLSHIRHTAHVGIYNAAINIVSGLIEYSDFHIVLLIWEDQERHIKDWLGRDVDTIKLPLSQKKYLDSYFKIHFCPKFLKKSLEQKHIDLVLTTCYTINSYVFPAQYNQIGVVHDMQPYYIAKMEKRWKYAVYWLVCSVIYYRLLKHIVAISDNTAKSIKKFSRKVSEIIYNSCPRIHHEEKRITGMDQVRYILDVNSYFKYKNTERLLMAFYRIKNEIPHTLYLKGYDRDVIRLKELCELSMKLHIEDRVIFDISDLSPSEMAFLYHHADLFVSPSLLEGFGLTPVEAVIHGCPVIVSNIPTLCEVTEGELPTFNPLSEEDIARAILESLRNPMPQSKRTLLAEQFEEKYSIKNQSKRYIDLISRICKS